MYRKTLAFLLTVVLLVSCFAMVPASAGKSAAGKAAIKITGSKYVAVGKKVTLKAGVSVKWSSSNKKIATVTKGGVVKGVKAGKVTITAKAADGTKAEWKMTVKAKPVKSVKITAPTLELDLNGTKTVKLKAKAVPASAAQSFEWKSSNKKVATVSSAGKVTAKAAGTVKITATATDGSKKSASVKLTVKKSSAGGRVGVSMPTEWLARWERDGRTMKSLLEKAGCKVTLKYADNDVPTQISQIEAMIDDGCEVVIVAAITGDGLDSVLALAMEKGVKVIAYDRLLMNTDSIHYYTTFNNEKVGALQANYIKKALDLDNTAGPYNIEFTAGDPGDNNAALFFRGAIRVLQPYLDSGKLVARSGMTEFADVATPAWRTETAQLRAEDILAGSYTDEKLDAWLCSNDSTALGVIWALEDNYTEAWPVITGQDCDRQNVKYIIQGKQAMSVFKDTATLAARAVKMARQILNGETVETNGSVNNGVTDVPAYLCAPVSVTKSNYRELLIDSGIYTEEMLQD